LLADPAGDLMAQHLPGWRLLLTLDTNGSDQIAS
jgi:hypothetical protein